MAFDLAAVLRAEGLSVVEEDGWQRRGYAPLEPALVMVHHTATGPDATEAAMRRLLVTHGRPDLPAPLCNLWIRRDGTVHVVADDRARHAGRGSGVVLDEARRGIAPSGPAAGRGLTDDTDGNRRAYGLECENDGVGEGWPAAQVEAIVRVSAALCRAHGWTAARVVAHREWTRRKPDPHGLAMDGLRVAIAHRLGTPAPQPAPTPTKAAPPAVTWEEALVGRLPTIAKGAGMHGAPNAAVKRLQGLLLAAGQKVTVDGRFGPGTDRSVRAFQKHAKITVDGIVGRGTWTHLLGLSS